MQLTYSAWYIKWYQERNKLINKICDVYKEVAKKYARTKSTVAGVVSKSLKTIDFSKEVSRKYFGDSGKKTSQYLFDFAANWEQENKEKEQMNEAKN